MKHHVPAWASVPLAGALSALSLIPAAPAAAKFGDQPLARGDSGRDVRVLQRWLGYIGHRTSVDGHFGAGTARAVRAYEREHDRRVDGRVSRGDAKDLRTRATAAYRQRGGAAPETDPSAATPRAVANTGSQATLSPDGRTAVAPADAPAEVKAAIEAANRITDKPYKYGGGHGKVEDSGYDCSGAVSYALRAAGALTTPLDSSGLARFGEAGEGEWITIYAHGSHAYVVIAGLRFDTSGSGEKGPRWRTGQRSGSGYTVRHPAGL